MERELSQMNNSVLDAKSDFVVAFIPSAFSINNPTLKYVDPQIVAAAIKLAGEMFKSYNSGIWQNEISSRLDEISKKLDQIIFELQGLRDYIDERITQETLFLFHSEISARRRSIETICAGIDNINDVDDSTKERLLNIMDEMDSKLWQLMNWRKFSFDPYPAVVIGIITKMLVLTVCQRPKGEGNDFIKKCIAEYFNEAKNTENLISIAYKRNDVAAQAINEYNYVNNRINKWWEIAVHQFTEGGDEGRPRSRHVIVNAIAQGSMNSPLSLKTYNETNKKSHEDYPNRNGNLTPEQFIGQLESKRLNSIALAEKERALRLHLIEVEKSIVEMSAYIKD